MVRNTELTDELLSMTKMKNVKVLNPVTGTLIFGKVPANLSGIPSGFIYLRLGYVANGYLRQGAFGARHVWEKHRKDLNINAPENLPQILADILVVGVDILYEATNKPAVLNTHKGLVSLQLKKDSTGSDEYSIVSAYNSRRSRGTVFAKLE